MNSLDATWKAVKTANIEVIHPDQLKVDDKILWSNLILRILRVPVSGRNGEAVVDYQNDNKFKVPMYRVFYRVKEYQTETHRTIIEPGVR